jgi:hypothetical protein
MLGFFRKVLFKVVPTAIRFIAAYHFAGVKIVVALESVQFEEPVRVHVQ